MYYDYIKKERIQLNNDTTKLSVFSSSLSTARALILRIITLMNQDSQHIFNIAVSGGSTPALLFDLWANEYKNMTPWHRIRLFWVDERCVPPSSSESHFGLMNSLLLYNVAIPKENVFRIDGENDPKTEAIRYSGLVRKLLPLEKGCPIFDIILLGAGNDGHTSSIFPGQEDLLYYPFPYAVSSTPENGRKRITMTGLPLLNGRHVFFFITGKVKSNVVKKIYDVEDINPAAYVFHHGHNVELFVDDLAASEIEKTKA